MHNKKGVSNGVRGFTLAEVLIAVGVIVILLVAVITILNPVQLLNQGRDGNRIAGIGTLDKSVGIYYSSMIDNPTAISMGTSSVVYLSVPDPNATTAAGSNCSGLGFVSSASVTYHCAGPSYYTNTDGTGWVPINFSSSSLGGTVSSLPVDPVNTAASGEYYTYTTDGVGGYEIMANPQATKNIPNAAEFTKGTNLLLLTTFPGATGGGATGPFVYVGDWNGYVLKYDTGGHYISEFPVSSGSPDGMAIDASGNIYVASNQFSGGWIDEYDSTGRHIAQIGSTGTGNGQFAWGPYGIAFDASGNIYAEDPGDRRVEKFTSGGTWITDIVPEQAQGSGNGQFTEMMSGLAVDSTGNIFVTDYNGSGTGRVEEFDSSGTFVRNIGLGGPGALGDTNGIAIGPNGHIYVTGGATTGGVIFYNNGDYGGVFGTYGTSTGQFSYGGSIAVDSSGNFYATPVEGGVGVDKFDSTGNLLTSFGTYGGSAGQLYWPHSIAVH